MERSSSGHDSTTGTGGGLPAPRDLLTSLINTLSSQPIPPSSREQQYSTQSASKVKSRNTTATAPSNPLALLPASSKTLLTTLHVIYPSLLLPALDLLDRGLVIRVLVLDLPQINPLSPQTSQQTWSSSQAQRDEAEQARHDAKASTFHLVRSAQQQSARRSRRAATDDGTGGPTYVVRTRAWNCDCAAFAFGAFPASAPSSSFSGPTGGYHIRSAYEKPEPAAVSSGRWEFGGLSFDGRPAAAAEDGGILVGSGTPPCCKHLLACVLAERWGTVLGDYVQERQVGKEEAAGLIGSL